MQQKYLWLQSRTLDRYRIYVTDQFYKNEMDLDLDFDLDDDKIKSFLQTKLSEIKSKNDQLQKTLEDRRQFSKNMIGRSNTQIGGDNIEIIAEVWNIFNGKYVIGVTVTNKSCRCLFDPKIILNWNSKYPLSYEVILYHKDDTSTRNFQPSVFCNEIDCNTIADTLKVSNKIDKLAYLVITFDRPQFVDKVSYNITGYINFQQDDREICRLFPPIGISSLDATDHLLNDFPRSDNEIKDILTMISASIKTDLVMIVPRGWSNSIDSTFEIICSLLKLDISSRCRKFFAARRLSPSFDNSLVEIHAPNKEDINVLGMAIYTRSSDYLFSLLHHLHRNIPGVVIIPKSLHENYFLQRCSEIGIREERRNLEEFNECLGKEIAHVKKFLQECQRNINDDCDTVKFRSDLADLEKCTDLYYSRLCKIDEQAQ